MGNMGNDHSIMAIIAFVMWVLFLAAYFVVRAMYPKLGRGKHKVKRGEKYDEQGFDKRGFSALGFHRNGTRYDDNGFDREGNPRPAGERTDLRMFDPVEPVAAAGSGSSDTSGDDRDSSDGGFGSSGGGFGSSDDGFGSLDGGNSAESGLGSKFNGTLNGEER